MKDVAISETTEGREPQERVRLGLSTPLFDLFDTQKIIIVYMSRQDRTKVSVISEKHPKNDMGQVYYVSIKGETISLQLVSNMIIKEITLQIFRRKLD